MGAAVGPIVDFFGRYGLSLGSLIFAFISTYRLTDYVMGTMTNTFYIDMGFSLTEIGVVAKFFGWPSTLVGAVLGGGSSPRSAHPRPVPRQRAHHHLQCLLCHVRSYACHIPLECAQSGLIDFWPSARRGARPADNLGSRSSSASTISRWACTALR